MEKRNELQKTLSPAAIWAMSLGSIIGFGCFVQGIHWMTRAGGPLPLIAANIVGAFGMVLIGKSYAYMISALPVAGGEFAYAYKGFGRKAAFICGWMLILGYISLIAITATGLPILMSYIFPDLLVQTPLYTMADFDIFLGEALFTCFFVFVFGVFNYTKIQFTGKLQFFMTIIMCLCASLAFLGTVTSDVFNPSSLAPYYGEGKSFLEGFLSVLALAPFLYVGFDCIPQAAEEYNFPHHKAKKLITFSICAGSCLHITMALITGSVIPWTEVTSLTTVNGAPVSWYTGAILEMALGRVGLTFVAVALLMAILTGINGFFMSSSRLIFGMARAKMLPSAFAQLHPKYQTPHKAIEFVLVVCLICPFFGRNIISWVVDMCSVGTAIAFLYTCASAYKLSKEQVTTKQATEENKPLSPVVSLGGCFISFVILLLLLLPFSPAFMLKESFIALFVWVFLGVLFYFLTFRSFNLVPHKEMDFLILGQYEMEKNNG